MYDFEQSSLMQDIKNLGVSMLKVDRALKVPDLEILLIQRKIGGFFLLASRLKAKVEVSMLIKKYL